MANKHLSDPLEYLYGELSPEAMAAAERHMKGCAQCRAALRDAREAVDAYRAAPRPKAPVGLAARAAATALGRVREERAASPSAALADVIPGRPLSHEEERACRQAVRSVMEEEFSRLRDEVMGEVPRGWRTWLFHPGWAIAASVLFLFSILIVHSPRMAGKYADPSAAGATAERATEYRPSRQARHTGSPPGEPDHAAPREEPARAAPARESAAMASGTHADTLHPTAAPPPPPQTAAIPEDVPTATSVPAAGVFARRFDAVPAPVGPENGPVTPSLRPPQPSGETSPGITARAGHGDAAASALQEMAAEAAETPPTLPSPTPATPALPWPGDGMAARESAASSGPADVAGASPASPPVMTPTASLTPPSGSTATGLPPDHASAATVGMPPAMAEEWVPAPEGETVFSAPSSPLPGQGSQKAEARDDMESGTPVYPPPFFSTLASPPSPEEEATPSTPASARSPVEEATPSTPASPRSPVEEAPSVPVESAGAASQGKSAEPPSAAVAAAEAETVDADAVVELPAVGVVADRLLESSGKEEAHEDRSGPPPSPLPPELLMRAGTETGEPAVHIEWQALVEPPQIVERPAPVNIPERILTLTTLASMAMAGGDFAEAREAVDLLRRYDGEAADTLASVLQAMESAAPPPVAEMIGEGEAPDEAADEAMTQEEILVGAVESAGPDPEPQPPLPATGMAEAREAVDLLRRYDGGAADTPASVLQAMESAAPPPVPEMDGEGEAPDEDADEAMVQEAILVGASEHAGPDPEPQPLLPATGMAEAWEAVDLLRRYDGEAADTPASVLQAMETAAPPPVPEMDGKGEALAEAADEAMVQEAILAEASEHAGLDPELQPPLTDTGMAGIGGEAGIPISSSHTDPPGDQAPTEIAPMRWEESPAAPVPENGVGDDGVIADAAPPPAAVPPEQEHDAAGLPFEAISPAGTVAEWPASPVGAGAVHPGAGKRKKRPFSTDPYIRGY